MQIHITLKGKEKDKKDFSKLKSIPENNTPTKNVIVVMAIRDAKQVEPSNDPNDKIKHYATDGEITTTAETYFEAIGKLIMYSQDEFNLKIEFNDIDKFPKVHRYLLTQ